jgi:hypothetical protein
MLAAREGGWKIEELLNDGQLRSHYGMFLSSPKGVQLTALAAESVHWMTGVPSFILLADIGDQRLRTLQLNFEGGNQRVFRVNDYVSRFPLTFKTNRKLHLCALPISVKSSTIQWGV